MTELRPGTIEIADGYRSNSGVVLKNAVRLRRIGRCSIKGPLVLNHCPALESVDPHAAFGGLVIEGAPLLHQLPAGLSVDGDLRLVSCTALSTLPPDLRVAGSLVLRGCPRLASIPPGIHVGGDVRVIGRTRLESLPAGLTIGGDLVLQRAVTSLPAGLRTVGNLALLDCVDLHELPAGLRIGGDLIVRKCPNLRALPTDLVVEGGIEARFSSFESLPHDLKVGTFVDLEGSSRLTSLPEGFHAPHSLRLRRCIRLERLPQGLAVGGQPSLGRSGQFHYSNIGLRGQASQIEGDAGVLNLENCARISELPPDMTAAAVEIAGTRIRGLPQRSSDHQAFTDRGVALSTGLAIRWRGVAVPPRVVFAPESFTATELLSYPNVEVRRVLFEILGAERLVELLQPVVVDEDTDPGGVRRLLRIRIPPAREALIFLECRCPSTGRTYVLRAPPDVASCHAAAAWIAGFDNPDDYKVLIET